MSDDFDPYYRWLAIPPNEQPANHYRLLGVVAFEDNLDVIEGGADQRMAHLRSFQNGPQAAHVQRLLNEISAAKVVLLQPQEKAAYDQQLRKTLAPAQPTASAVPVGRTVGSTVAAPVIVSDPPRRTSPSAAKSRQKSGSKTPLIVGGLAAAIVVVLLLIFLLPGGDAQQADRSAAVIEPSKSNPTPAQHSQAPANRTPARTATQPATPRQPATAVQPRLPATDNPASTIPTTTEPAGSAREMLVRILAARGTVRLETPAGPQTFRDPAELPAGNLKVWEVNLPGVMHNDAGLAGLQQLNGLERIYCNNGQITDQGLRTLSSITSLKLLDLKHHPITDAGLAHLRPLVALETLAIDGTSITDAGLVQLQPLENLKFLGISKCRGITGRGFAGLKGMKSLSTLRTNGIALHEPSLAFLGDLPELKNLDLIESSLSDAGLPYLAKLSQLTSLKITHTNVTAAGAAELQQALPDCKVVWGGPSRAPAAVTPPAVAATDPPAPVTTPEVSPTAIPAGVLPAVAVWPFDAAQAAAHQQAWAKHLGTPVETTNSIEMKLVVIPPGEFRMGVGSASVPVTLTQPFRFGVYEVTQAQWQAVMETTPWQGKSDVEEGANHPASNVSWQDAVAFCEQLTGLERRAKRITANEEYRLPTTAEWEWACRAGTTTTYSFGDDVTQLGEYAWFDENAKNAGQAYAHPVGQKRPNPWGLYDIHGNVREWCLDFSTKNYPGGRDPQVTAVSPIHIYRGGCWMLQAGYARSSNNYGNSPNYKISALGFRVALCPLRP